MTCPTCGLEEEEIDEGIEMHWGYGLAGALFIALIIIGVWEILKAVLSWLF